MRTKAQRGEGRLGSIVSLLVLAGVIYAAWNIAPAYVKNGFLKDKMNEIARSPRGTVKDDQILDMLDQYVREQGLDAYVQRSMFQVTTLDTSRRITLVYQRPLKILPGVQRTKVFEISVDQPLIW
jgi:hypothetical protein